MMTMVTTDMTMMTKMKNIRLTRKSICLFSIFQTKLLVYLNTLTEQMKNLAINLLLLNSVLALRATFKTHFLNTSH